MMDWKKTSCVLCGNQCGLEARVGENRIVKLRGDKDNPRSQGYVCRKGLGIHHYQHHADRLFHPLKRAGSGFERISWDQAFDEIAEKLSGIVEANGPRSLALMMGGGAIGCPAQVPFAFNLLRSMGSQYFYSAVAQELTGRYWVDGQTYGDQNLHTDPDLSETDMLLIVGWNPMMSHHLPQARRVLTRFAKDPAKLLVVVDPRVSETARIADIHLPIRPGTDALFYRALIAIILRNGWHDRDYIDRHVSGFERVETGLAGFDPEAALQVCGLDFERVSEIARRFAAGKSSHHSDLGVLMTRHSTLISYLENVLLAICGRIGVPGGNLFPLSMRSSRSKETPAEREARLWRTVATDFPAITGVYPPNVMPEEILCDDPQRLRAVLVSTANPLRSYADTSAYEKAFKELELLVTVEVSMTETAALSHYVLPARSGYESWDGGPRPEFPEIFMQIRPPVLEPEGERREAGEIFLNIADRLGLIPGIPQSLYDAARSGDRPAYGAALVRFLKSEPTAGKAMPFILGKTLGLALGSVHLAALWGGLQNLSESFHALAQRQGFTPGAALGEEIFAALLDHPEGMWIGSADPQTWDHLSVLATPDGRIHLHVPELDDILAQIEPELESAALDRSDTRYPLVMSCGRHWDMNANSQMRDPQWNRGKKVCTVLMHPEDAERVGVQDGQQVRITTEGGEETVDVEISSATRPGYVVMPHGSGLVHQGETYGANANRLAKNTHRDPVVGTPLHRYVPCRVEAAGNRPSAALSSA